MSEFNIISQMFSEVGGGVNKKLKPDALMKSILKKGTLA